MRKLLLLILVLCTTGFGSFAQQQKYSRVKIITGDDGLRKLASLGIPAEEGIHGKGYFISEFSQDELAKIRSNGFATEVLIDDWQAYYLEKNRQEMQQPLNGDPKFSKEWPVPNGFSLGSLGGFCTRAEFQAHLDNMAALYPNLITVKQSIGNTVLNEPIYFVKISDNPNVAEDEPQILYTGMHHAREPIGMQHLLYYMYYLLENYETNPEVKYLVDNTEMYFVPVFNVDGYYYNETTNPNGGGMWRKNRTNNGGGSYGIDLNRNYDYMWGYDNNGSSPYPDDETYRGTEAFSEPETQAIRDFCTSHNFKIAINYHSVSGMLLYPWGYTEDVCPDDQIFYKQATILATENHYTYGPASTTIYITNGGSDDWMYGEQTTKNKILSYTPEIAGSGFWPTVSEIIPLCQENMYQSWMAAWFVHGYGFIEDATPGIISEPDGYLKFEVSQLGTDDSQDFTITVTPQNNAISTIGEPVIITGLQSGQSKLDSIPFTLRDDIAQGDLITYFLTLNDGYREITDTLTKIFGTPVVIFNDTCENLNNWSSTYGWNTTSSAYHSAPKSITDSPNGSYQNNTNSSVTLTTPVDLAHAGYAILNFWAKWETEPGYDFVQVKISDDGGATWTPLTGKYTKPGSDNQIPGEPLYDGTQNAWVNEEIDLGDYLGEEVLFRFTLISDGGVTGDGFYFDDFQVIIIDNTTGIGENRPFQAMLSPAMPNPADNFTAFGYQVPGNAQNAALQIYDITGKRVKSLILNETTGQVNISLTDLLPGMYFCKIEGNNFQTAVKKLIVK
ncbi:MAG: immune inhibitor A [Lentimicrobiaceae bacterium]|nr:immune inhibitor A [Lentimicrobiaceae bacterium]